MADFYIADTHFGHRNVLKYDPRPFADLEEMEAALIQNWNGTVTETDRVYILGDFIWGGAERWLEIVPKLRGKKVLLRGNHDLKKMPPALRAQFETVADYMEVRDGDRRAVLCHYPILLYNHSHFPDWYMLCGHVHTTGENDYLEAWKGQLRARRQTGSGNRGNIYNVGCMMPWMDYTPRTLDDIIVRAEVYG